MLQVECPEYLNDVRAAASKMGKRDLLEKELKYLGEYACHVDNADGEDVLDILRTRCLLYTDFAPLSFGFTMQLRQEDGSYKNWFNGGCIFHGQVDGFGSGSAPTFSVCLNPTDGWSIHT